jgi:hypothetical protein
VDEMVDDLSGPSFRIFWRLHRLWEWTGRQRGLRRLWAEPLRFALFLLLGGR